MKMNQNWSKRSLFESKSQNGPRPLSASSLAHFPPLCCPAAAPKMQMSNSGSGSDSDSDSGSGHWMVYSGCWPLAKGEWGRKRVAEQKTLNWVWPTLNEPSAECRQHNPTHCVCYILFTKCKCCLQSLKLKQIYIYARTPAHKPKNKSPKRNKHTHKHLKRHSGKA